MDDNRSNDTVVKIFRDLCLQASQAEDAELNRFLETEYSAVLDYVIRHPTWRNEFGSEFIRMVTFPGTISAELVEYCMYELRWPEVAEAARSMMNTSDDPRNISVFEHILESFQDDWDKEGYERWG